ncbi:MAG: LysR substrate-binding domain-containing protein [Pseudomonadota bacterium]
MIVNRLKYFIAVAEHLSFSKAADHLHMSQPPLSQQIQKLETEVGAELFRRTKRSVVLTAAGEELLKGARLALAQVERAASTARAADCGEIGSIACGFTDDNVRGLVIDVMMEFHHEFPSARILSQVGDSRMLTALVERGHLDLAVVSQAAPSQAGAASLKTQSLPKLEFVAIVPLSYRSTDITHIDLQDLRDEPFIFIPSTGWTGFYAQTSRMFDEAGFTPRIIHETFSTDTIISLVTAGAGVSLVTRDIAQMFEKSVKILSLRQPSYLSRTAVWRQDNKSPLLNNFLRILKAFEDM